jgi:hypothetical protein
LKFVEPGTASVLECGCDDEAHYSALERKVWEIVRALDGLSSEERASAIARLTRLAEHRNEIGWGCADFLPDVAAALQARRAAGVDA